MDENNINSNSIDHILSIIKREFGGLPLLEGSSWNSAAFDLSNLFFQLRKYGFNLIFAIGTDVDEQDSNLHNIVVCILIDRNNKIHLIYHNRFDKVV